jgi:4,5-DOPA dioxygenase extradiol
MDRMPTLFVSHGAPTFALEPGRAGAHLAALGRRLPRPAAIVVLSPHWMTRGIAVQSGARPATVHDFGGFPEPLYRLRYPAPGAPALAAQVQALLASRGLAARLDPEQGYDHGAWVPLLHLFPDADVPVVQVSLPAGADARAVHSLGTALATLRDAGVLLIGSGSITHNLRDVFGRNGADRPPPGYARAFMDWTAAALRDGREADLLDWAVRAPHAQRAHPTDEHLLPLHFALGAAGPGARAREVLDGEVIGGVLGMDSYVLDGDGVAGVPRVAATAGAAA